MPRWLARSVSTRMKTTFFGGGGGGRRVQAAGRSTRPIATPIIRPMAASRSVCRSVGHMGEEFVVNQGTEFLQTLRLGGAFAGLDDDDVRQVRGILVRLVAFDPLEDRQLALTVAAPADRRETARGQGLVEHLAVPQEAVPPAVEGAIEAQGVVALDVWIDRRLDAKLVVRGPHPVEIGGREPQPAALAHHPVRFAEEVERVIDR